MHLRQYKTQARILARGLINPAVIRALGPRNYDLRDTLVICGFPRSGTTWLAEVIAALPGFGLIFEPLNIDTVPAARDAGFDRDNFRTSGEIWPQGEHFLRKALQGQVLTRWTTSDIPLARAASINRWVVKFVRASQMLAWITERFPIPPPLLLLRHPCAVHASWLERGWPLLRSAHFNARFMAAYPQFEDVMSTLRQPEEFLAARWCQAHFHALSTPRPWPFNVAFYEHLLANPADELGRILAVWGLQFPAGAIPSVSRPSAKASDQLVQGSTVSGGGWRRRLAPEVIQRILHVVTAFGLDFYNDDSQPRLDHPILAPARAI